MGGTVILGGVAGIEWLPRVVPAPPGKPVRDGAIAAQDRARRVARHPDSWSRVDVEHVVAFYADAAASWDEERGSYRPAPLRDALARGGPLPAGPALEVGAGTGLLTPIVADAWPHVVCVDLSAEMLARSGHPWRVRADAAGLPLRPVSFAAVVLADAPLFAAEVIRVLRADGVVVWSNALGRQAPQYVPTADVVAALEAADGGVRWTARASEAGWGSWAVLRRTAGSADSSPGMSDRAASVRGVRERRASRRGRGREGALGTT